MGKTPRLLASHDQRVAIVACHPQQEVVAVGYEDGMVLLMRIEDGAEILARKPGAGAGLGAGMEPGRRVVGFGTEDGEAGLIQLT